MSASWDLDNGDGYASCSRKLLCKRVKDGEGSKLVSSVQFKWSVMSGTASF